MVNATQTVSTGVSNPAQHARASAASAGLVTGPIGAASTAHAAVSLPSDQAIPSVDRAYKYNSFEFSYRQDFGKIVLLRQKPDTGEVVQQFPSEYYLRKYADSQRVAQTAAGEGRDNAEGKAALTKSVSPPAPESSPATSIPPAPSLPLATGGSFASLNLTV